jgi:hypothetical protein
MSKEKPFQIISPDGFSINAEGGFDTWQEALQYFDDWKNQFKRQGYYRNSRREQIHLSDLEDECQWIGFNNVPPYEYLPDEEKAFIDSLAFTQE